MRSDPEDTIVAIASPPGASARAIVRISGPQTPQIVASVCTAGDWQASRTARRWPGALRLSAFSVTVPCDLLYWP
ncbi:MAG: hypothetical protein ACK5AN_01555, partial [Planctomyces sp.]